MHIDCLFEFNHDLLVEINNQSEFLNLGTLVSDEEGLLTYCENIELLENALTKNNLSALFVNKEVAEAINANITLIISENPKVDFYLFHDHLVKNTDFYGSSITTQISSNVNIHPSVFIAENNVEIAENVEISANAVILENTLIRSGVYLGPGTVVGIDGTQTIEYGKRKYFRISHAGGVSIGESTFIGANSVIARSLFRKRTSIGRNVTIGNLVNVGHNSIIQDDTMVLSNAVLCGSSLVETGARVSPGAVIASSKRIGERAWVTIGSVVSKDVENDMRVSGNFAIEHKKFIKHIINMAKT